MPRPRPVTYQGITYLTTGWALGDILRLEPMASDQRIAELLNVPPQQVGYWRRKAGIPAYKLRGASPYVLISPFTRGRK